MQFKSRTIVSAILTPITQQSECPQCLHFVPRDTFGNYTCVLPLKWWIMKAVQVGESKDTFLRSLGESLYTDSNKLEDMKVFEYLL